MYSGVLNSAAEASTRPLHSPTRVNQPARDPPTLNNNNILDICVILGDFWRPMILTFDHLEQVSSAAIKVL